MSSLGYILVTGGAGYIGSHVCKELHSQGYIPICYDNLQGGHAWAVKWGPFLQGDIHDTQKLYDIMQQYKPLAVFHMASSINVRESLCHPDLYYHNNVVGTLSLLEAMKKANVSHIIFSSTASIFGNPKYTPIDEMHPKEPLHAYGKSKYMVEMILEDFDRAYGIISASLRYFNASGADSSCEIGEAHTPETHLIPLVIQSALGQRSHIDIYGDDYSTPDGTAIRDYIHVSDLAKAHIKALDWIIAHNQSIQLNLGTGSGYSIKEVIHAVEELSGYSVPWKIGPKSPDAGVLVATSRKATELTGWSAKTSSLKEIVSSALAWHQKKD